MKKLLVLVTLLALTGSVYVTGGTSDEAAVNAVALDYIEGYYTGDAVRMERALHPELAKRIVVAGPDGHGALQNMSAAQLIGATRAKAGNPTPVDRRRMDVKILDIYENSASVRITAGEWVDYMHIGKVDGEWKIINVLWEMTP
jgi:hypothetical protein